MARMAGEAGVEHLGHAAFDRLAQLDRVLALTQRAHRQRFEALHDDPGVERRDIGAGVALEGQQHLVDPFLRTADRTCQHSALPIHELGRAIGDDVRAEIQRLLQRTCGEGVVDHGGDAMRLCHCADMGEVDHVERRIGRSLEEKDLRVGPDRGFPGAIVRAVDHGGLDPEAREQMVEQPPARTEGGARTDHVVAGRQLAEQCGGHCGHSARLRAASFCSLHQRDALFEHGDSRVLEPRIGHALRFACKAVGDRLRIVVSIAGGQEQGLARLAMLAAPGAAAHGLRGRTPFGGDRAVHSGGFLHATRDSTANPRGKRLSLPARQAPLRRFRPDRRHEAFARPRSPS